MEAFEKTLPFSILCLRLWDAKMRLSFSRRKVDLILIKHSRYSDKVIARGAVGLTCIRFLESKELLVKQINISAISLGIPNLGLLQLVLKSKSRA